MAHPVELQEYTSFASSWTSHDNVLMFQNDTAPVIPRAWDRFPKAPFALHHKGQKVWKRYELRSKKKDPSTTSGKSAQTGGENSEGQVNGNLAASSRPVKRLCLDQVSDGGEHIVPNKATNYIATLRDRHASTPRRKISKRKSLRRGTPVAKSVVENVECEDISLPISEPQTGSADLSKSSKGSLDAIPNIQNDIEDRNLPHSNTISLISGSTISRRSTLDNADQRSCLAYLGRAKSDALDHSAPEVVDELQLATLVNGEELNTPSADLIERSENRIAISSAKRTYRMQMIGSDDYKPVLQDQSERTLLGHSNGFLTNADSVAIAATYATMHENLVLDNTENVSVIDDVNTAEDDFNYTKEKPCDGSLKSAALLSIGELIAPAIDKFDEQPLRLEQISPTTKQLNESASDYTHLKTPIQPTAYSVGERYGLHATTDSSAAGNDLQSKGTTVQDHVEFAGEPCEQASKFTIGRIGALVQSVVEDKSSAEISEAISMQQKLCEHPPHNPSVVAPSPHVVGAYQSAAEDVQCSEQASNHVLPTDSNVSAMIKEQPESRTRSGARFSDDTTLLKDFLNRAQARKAGKVQRHASGLIASPRKPLAVIDKNSPSPKKAKSRANQLLTPPSKPKVETVFDDVKPLSGPESCRRSARTRSPAPSKPPLGAPSLIPVRRADGTEHVVLQRSGAQELATMTRANTRRNKGHAKPPKLVLEGIPLEVPGTWLDAQHQKGSAKAVSWDETLAYFLTTEEAKDGKESQIQARPKAKRLKGLGTTNGTPAPKKAITDMTRSNGEAALKRRNKART